MTVVLAVMAAGVHSTSIAAAAPAEPEHAAREAEAAAERSIVPTPAATEGLPVPALIGGIVLAFAVGLSAGHVQRRRRAARRREALPGPAPVPDPPGPARPAPPPPEPVAKAQPKPVTIAPAPAPPAPAPPEPPPEPPEIVAPAPEPAVEPEPPEIVAPAPEPAVEPDVVPPPEPVRRPARRRRPAFGSASSLSGAPEVRPRDKAGTSGREPVAPPRSAPESPGLPPRRGPVGQVPPTGADASSARPFARPRPWPEAAETLWTCEIAWKAGYVKSTFRAMAGPPGGDVRRRPIGESPSLRWTLMTDPEPPTPEMTASVRALMTALIAAGWERTEPGGAWYAQRFLWRGEGEPGPVTVPGPPGPAEPPSR